MPMYRHHLPQLDGGYFLTDGGLETDLVFNRGVEIPEFAAHTLLAYDAGHRALEQYFRPFLELAARHRVGYILDCPTGKAHRHWADALGTTPAGLERANHDAVAFVDTLRLAYGGTECPVILNAVVGPRGDAYAPERAVTAAEARDYHAEQLGWLAATDVDMVSALTFTQSPEAVGFVEAARARHLPTVVSFTVETDGRLPSGQDLAEAVRHVDRSTGGAAAYYMVNCAHPDHLIDAFDDGDWARRVRGLRCNASRRSHAELDACDTLDAGDPAELAAQYRDLLRRMPWINVLGGCCGTDLRHVAAIAVALPAPVGIERAAPA